LVLFEKIKNSDPKYANRNYEQRISKVNGVIIPIDKPNDADDVNQHGPEKTKPSERNEAELSISISTPTLTRKKAHLGENQDVSKPSS